MMKRFMCALALAATTAFPALAQTGQGTAAAETAVTYSTEALRRFNEGLSGQSDREVIEGRIG